MGSQGVNLLCREGNSLLGHWKTETNLENLFPRLVVFCLLLSSLSFTPTKRYEEVDGVRKEKERLTTDHQPPNSYLFAWCSTFICLFLCVLESSEPLEFFFLERILPC